MSDVSAPTSDEVIALEKSYWDAMKAAEPLSYRDKPAW